MKSRHLWVICLFLFAAPAAAENNAKPEVIPEKPNAATVQLILEAPGPVSCYKNGGNLPASCVKREAGVREAIHLYQENPDVAVALLEKRLAMDPDPHGVFFAILVVSKTGDEVFVSDLQSFRKRRPNGAMARFAKEAIVVIETGRCSKHVDPDLVEICPSPR